MIGDDKEERSMARDAEATKGRILEAACAEFARVGLAGARVERIAALAQSNVRMLYAYFGGKEALFDASYAHLIAAMAAEVPPRPDDLPGWAADLVRYHERDPRAMRISMWAQLERPEATAEPSEIYAGKVGQLGLPTAVAPLGAADVLMLIYAMAQAWQLSPAGLTALAATGIEPRAAAASVAARRLLGPGPGEPGR
jgi:AcrR family transcriptional regulator